MSMRELSQLLIDATCGRTGPTPHQTLDGIDSGWLVLLSLGDSEKTGLGGEVQVRQGHGRVGPDGI